MPPFPTTPLLDNFIRADEDPISQGGNWSNPVPSIIGAGRLVSNQLIGSVSGGCANRYARTDFDIESWATLATVSGTARDVSVTCRGSGTDSTYNSYSFTVTTTTGAWVLQRIVNLVATTLTSGTLAGGALVAGNSIGIQAISTLLIAWANIGGVWSVVSSIADTTFASGSIAVVVNTGSDVAFSAFGGGRYDPGSSPADDRYRFKPSQHFVHHTRVGAKRALWPDDAGILAPHKDAERDKVSVIV
jgi:hypothetical protein